MIFDKLYQAVGNFVSQSSASVAKYHNGWSCSGQIETEETTTGRGRGQGWMAGRVRSSFRENIFRTNSIPTGQRRRRRPIISGKRGQLLRLAEISVWREVGLVLSPPEMTSL